MTTKDGDVLRTDSARPGRLDDEAGVTLVELLVSIAILGIVLAAFAGSIVVSLRSITATEHEVIATQYVAEVSESIQHGDFEFVGLYSDEVDPTAGADAAAWAARLDAPGVFEGNAVVEFAGPGSDRDDRIPAPFVRDTRGGIDLRVDRYITWVDRDGDGVAETKRLTSFASWTDGQGEPRELRFESERVPTQVEASADVLGRRVIDFRFSPDPVQLSDTEGEPVETVTVDVRTNVPTLLGTLQVYEYDELLDVWVLRTITMSTGEAASSGWVTWTADVPSTYDFANGQVDFLFTGTEASPADPSDATFTGVGTLDTFGGPWNFVTPTPGTDFVAGTTPVSGDPDPDPTVDPGPDVSLSVTARPSDLCVDPSTWKTPTDVVIEVETTGLDLDDGTVRATYPYYAEQPIKSNGSPDKNVAPTANADGSFGLLSGDESSAVWSLTIPRGTVFNPEKYRNVTFDISAERNGGAFAADVDTDAFTVTTKTGC